MKREYWYIIITYLIMQYSVYIGVPLFMLIGTWFGAENTIELRQSAGIYYVVFSFIAGLAITLYLLRREWKEAKEIRHDRASVPMSIFWAAAGVFLALFAQGIAAKIETYYGTPSSSENTQQIVNMIQTVPIMVFVSSVIGPILEEIIFRKIIFGALRKRMPFILAALISALIFGLAHGENEHLLVYMAMGMVFAFVYARTNRIIVSICSHVAMNTLVVLAQMAYRNMDSIIKETEKVQNFIGGFL